MKENRYYIYGYFEVGSLEPFYIGKGCGRRAYQHLNPSSWRPTHFYNKVKQLLAAGRPPTVEILLENLTEKEALDEEVKYIRFYGRADLGTGCLLNHSTGGEGQSGWTQPESQRAAMRGNQFGCRGRGVKKRNPSPRRKPVVAISCGTIVDRFDSITAIDAAGYCSRPIKECLNGKRAMAYGLIWEYAKET